MEINADQCRKILNARLGIHNTHTTCIRLSIKHKMLDIDLLWKQINLKNLQLSALKPKPIND